MRRTRLRPNNALLWFVLAVIIFEEVTVVLAGKDYYDILGVARDADSATIKRAFRKLAIKYHPGKYTVRGTETANSAVEIFSAVLFERSRT